MIETRLHCARELRELVLEVGCIPLFRGDTPGFSVEELTPEEYWFKDGVEGPWEWREQLAADGEIAYAKYFHGRAGFIAPELYPDFANFRRDGYDFDARVDDGLVKDAERRLYALIADGIFLSSDLRRAFGSKGFESAITSLQMNLYVGVAGFDRRRDKHGVPYGWGIARYATCEALFGDLCTAAYDRSAEESHARIVEKLSQTIPREDAMRLLKV